MIKLIHGECLEEMAKLEDNSIDMVMTDPPYGTTACKWDSIIPLEPMWEQLKRIVKPNGAIVMTAAQPFTTKLISSNYKMFKYCWVWEKPQGVDPFMAKVRPLNNIEDVVIFSKASINYFPQIEKGKPYHVVRDKNDRTHETTGATMKVSETKNKGTRLPKRIIKINQQKGLHPTQKPVALMEYLIKTYTNESDTVLDFTAGSFTTGVACVNTNRNFVGIELDKGYFDVGVSRVKESIKCLNLKIEPTILTEG